MHGSRHCVIKLASYFILEKAHGKVRDVAVCDNMKELKQRRGKGFSFRIGDNLKKGLKVTFRLKWSCYLMINIVK